MSPKTIDYLPLADLCTPGYQRPLLQRRVREIVKKFDPNLVDPPTVSFRDFHYWIVDGQHTVAALLARGIVGYNCTILKGLTYEEEARLFAARNARDTSRRLTAADEFKALLESRDETAWKIHEIAHALDLYFPFEGGDTTGIRCLAAVAECRKTAARHGLQVLGDTLRIITAAWPAQPRRLHNLMIEGIGHFVARNRGKFDEKRLINRLATTSPATILADSMTLHQLQGMKRHDAVVERIAALYDKGLRSEVKRLKTAA